jgi:polyhydroxyalkanoate synthesis regulator phasin
MITKEGFIEATGMEAEKAEKLYENLNDRFNGNWDEASNYLKELIKYLQKHQ